MATLIEKIEANARERLVYTPDRPPSSTLALYARFLKVEAQRIKIAHGAGAGGRETCGARAVLLDIIISSLWENAKRSCSPQAQKEFPPMALVAIGGYGRGELNPQSDIDFMFLHNGQVVASGKPLPLLAKVIDGVLYPLWDLGFKVGHSVRTIPECVAQANQDMQSKTSLIEARLITGDRRAFERLEKAILAKCVLGREDAYIDARMEDQAERRSKFGNSPTMQEPNIKNGCGGLRDYQNLLWMTHFKYQTRSLAEMEKREFLSASERKHLEAAYDFLLSVRSELHFQTGRAVDVLTRNLQPTIATRFGYTNRSPTKRLERFMRTFYTHTRRIFVITRTLEERLTLLPRKNRLASLGELIRSPFRTSAPQVVDGFKFEDGQIKALSSRVFREKPRRLMRLFLHAQKRGLRIHPDLAQLARQSLSLVDRGFLRDERVRHSFLEILNQRGNVAPILRAMHEVGFLGKYIPEFGKLTCLVQHEFYHQYTADEHTLVCLEKLDSVAKASSPPASNYKELLQEIDRPYVLYLALLLHDAGKAGDSGDHSAAGVKLALRVARRFQFDGTTAHSLALLIEHHLAMAQISQRRDLDDEAELEAFANLIQSADNLRMLTLHTFADSLATSNKLWNGFKDGLLRELYHKSLRLILGGTAFIRAEARQLELMAKEVADCLPPSFSNEEVEAHFQSLPPHYFSLHTVKDVARDLTLTHRFMHHQLAEEEKALEPVVTWHNEPDRGYTSATICTWDRDGLFSKIAGSFSVAGINILSARVFTRTDGIVLDRFYVTDAATGKMVGRAEKEKFESILCDALTGGNSDFRQLLAKKPKTPYQSIGGDIIETRVRFDNKTSPDRTIIEVETEDRLGVLHVISRVLNELKVRISLAKINTDKGAAVDVFYVRGDNRKKIAAPERVKQIKEQLLQALS